MNKNESELPEPKWHKVFDKHIELAEQQENAQWLAAILRDYQRVLDETFDRLRPLKRRVGALGMALLFNDEATEGELQMAEFLLRASGDYRGSMAITPDNQMLHRIDAGKASYRPKKVEDVITSGLEELRKGS